MKPFPSPPPPAAATVRVFSQRFSSTKLGARLARHFATYQLQGWGFPYGSDVSERAALVVAELATNAVTHGRVPGRDFELRLSITPGRLYLTPSGALDRAADLLRIEVSDVRGEVGPPGPGEVVTPAVESLTGRGLPLVEAFADRWEVLGRPFVGKTVRAELDLPR